MSSDNQIIQGILLIAVVAIVAYVIYFFMNKNDMTTENYAEAKGGKKHSQSESSDQQQGGRQQQQGGRQQGGKQQGGQQQDDQSQGGQSQDGMTMGPDEPYTQMEHFQGDMPNRESPSFPAQQLTATELLPADNSSQWAQVYPTGEGSLKDRNFLQAGYHIGINTVGQTLRNANQQLRSEPPCPQVKVSPWLQSTIDPDLGRKPFEIGGCA